MELESLSELKAQRLKSSEKTTQLTDPEVDESVVILPIPITSSYLHFQCLIFTMVVFKLI